ncbi:MAG: hypothetical protein ABR505_11475 [Actinomycetota bacterium]
MKEKPEAESVSFTRHSLELNWDDAVPRPPWVATFARRCRRLFVFGLALPTIVLTMALLIGQVVYGLLGAAFGVVGLPWFASWAWRAAKRQSATGEPDWVDRYFPWIVVAYIVSAMTGLLLLLAAMPG